MSYQVLALKYRPQTFEAVVGQHHVTTTLANAISSDRVAHALLFTGPRGTGKTTIARILAKAMNCEKGPAPIPCNTCKICTDIIDGHCSDVFEIDGASNNSVDQIRDLRENVKYIPSSARYKIYIIDEVHMLSTAAFNALLKTLEEPPDHVMFIFATTEVHKIPATILSRCQRHDLGRITLDDILKHLENLCKKEGFDIQKQSLELIAQQADGSVRDSLSLLDRVLSSSIDSKIDHTTILDNLGIIDRGMLHDLTCAIFEKNGARLIECIETINHSGIDLKKYYSDLIEHFRNLCVLKICGKNTQAVNIPESEKEKIFQSTLEFSSEYLTALLQTVLNEELLVKNSTHPKTAIEMVLLKLLEINPGQQIDQILLRLDTLAKNIAGASRNIEYHAPLPDDTDRQVSAVKEEHSPLPAQPMPPVEKKHTWADFLKKVETAFPFIFALLTKIPAPPESEDDIILHVNDCSAFDQKRLESKEKQLQDLCSSLLGRHLTIHISPKKKTAPASRKKEIKARQAAYNHPFVVDAQKLFNGQIINI
ncbi:MAG: DNA polymerase III subunit gamma/tau [Proteobacteria bacterium]|nr:DNA polymerase III subunit gamma/tau [Pseudomonadota bacterium]MBU1389414.1 DNA polymerase III subunit gamma/tau [Pseudomonadota bacterium]MBU1541234.1 DNA polymerase III subunit gamma/tau [Pseudomonadota bacterium]MBU2430079.1 DNA polymerase III subunit gamma/tau [Pseudomonadota bacterium]MBU2481046.1 DNA polymerase III subunit gamma/tau [Pseudomonadota bacterium]